MATEVKQYICGDLDMHWYNQGDACECGQVPTEIFFSSPCNCGVSRLYRNPVHSPECSYIEWAKKRNQWLKEHKTNPPVDAVSIRASKYYQDWNESK